MHTIAVIALPDVSAFDLATPIELFGRVAMPSGEPGYRVIVCATDSSVTAGPIRIATEHGIDEMTNADTVIVPGRNDVTAETPPDVITALRAASSTGMRIASICTGSFTLAAAGLLDGRRATTHWSAAAFFRFTYPSVLLDPDVLYVDDGQVLTSAGASAGIDLCLHMVQCDYGAAIAADTARMAVAPLHRSGGQAQFIVRNRAPSSNVHGKNELGDVLGWIETEAHRDLGLDEIAGQAGMSTRTLNRRFQSETDQTPMQWVIGVRVRHAQQLLETTDLGVELIGRTVGFASAANFRDQFRRLTGVPPRSYRFTFRSRSAH